jgi:hypothetical protein
VPGSPLLSVASLLIHYEALRGLSFVLLRIALRRPRQKMLIVVGGALIAHLVEIVIFALAFSLVFELLEQSLYLSIESYASLGTSTGLRLLCAIESLVGLILIR